MHRNTATHLVDEYHPRHNLCHTLIYITFHDPIHFPSKLLCDFCPSTLHQTTHYAHDVLASLWSRIGSIEVTQSHVLHEFFALVDVALREWDVRFRLQVVGRRVRV